MITKLGYAEALKLLQRAQASGLPSHIQNTIKQEAYKAGQSFKGAPHLRAKAYDVAANKASQRLAPHLHTTNAPAVNTHLHNPVTSNEFIKKYAPDFYRDSMTSAASWQ